MPPAVYLEHIKIKSGLFVEEARQMSAIETFDI